MHRTLHHTCGKSFVKVDSPIEQPSLGPVIPERQPAGHSAGGAERCGEIDMCVYGYVSRVFQFMNQFALPTTDLGGGLCPKRR